MQSREERAEKHGWRAFAAMCLLRWHLCSLDAPTVAVVWAMTLGRLAGTPLRAAEILVLGLGTWIVYVLDRILDGAGAPCAKAMLDARLGQLQERHHFHRRYRRSLLSLCGGAAMLLALACGWLAPRLILFYLALSLPVLLYAACVHRRLVWPLRSGREKPGRSKEAAVALLFTAAVAGPALVRGPSSSKPILIVAAILLAALCWLNCSLISHAEALAPLEHRRRSLQRAGWALASITAALAGGWAIARIDLRRSYAAGWQTGVTPSSAAATAAALLLSCLAMILLLGQRGAPRRLRVLADLGLLTPLLFLLVRF